MEDIFDDCAVIYVENVNKNHHEEARRENTITP
jgi:hypothetical protein